MYSKHEKVDTLFQAAKESSNKRIALGKHGFMVPFVGYGCLQLEFSGKSEQEQIDFIVEAYTRGVRFFDTAAAYGMDRHNEMIMGKALQKIKEQGGELPIISTKCGIVFNPDSPYLLAPHDIEESVQKSLSLLGIECIDLLYVHRLDPHLSDENFDAVMFTLNKLVREGKIKHIGLSECNEKQIRAASKIVPINSVELAYSLFTRRAELNGVWDVCQELGIGLVAYTSIVRGALDTKLQTLIEADVDTLPPAELQAEVFKILGIDNPFIQSVGFFSQDHIQSNVKAILEFQKIAGDLKVTPFQLALAWLGYRGVVSIPGTTNLDHLQENIKAMAIDIPVSVMTELTEKFYPGRFKGNPSPSQLKFLDDATLEESNVAEPLSGSLSM